MPADQRPVGGADPTRRQAVIAGLSVPALVVLAGCSLRVGQPDADPTMPPPSADELARERVAVQADALATSAAATARLRPDAARQLAVITEQHRQHAAALRPTPTLGQSSTTTATTTAGGTATTTARAATKANALSRQAGLEREGAAAVETELAKVSGDVARLLASVAASRSVHADTLDSLAERDRT